MIKWDADNEVLAVHFVHCGAFFVKEVKMAKDTGFIEYNRVNNEDVPPLERIAGEEVPKRFCEFHKYLNEEERRQQAARCMDCGVPMCQSGIKLAGMVTGCPLGNLIPEWNDALYKGQFDMAAWRLLKTSNFPEFTGRVCPALCEKACNLGNPALNGGKDIAGSVSVHDNELYIIEHAFETGYMKPQAPKVRSNKKVAIVGSGPSGLACADSLNHRGHTVTVFERDDRAGGLLMYGIPNMKLDKKIVDRRINLMKQEGVVFKTSYNVCKDNASEILGEYDAVVLCAGAKKARPLVADGSDAKGVMYAVDFLKGVTASLLDAANEKEFLKVFQSKGMPEVQDKDVIIVGGGDTGNDCTGSVIRLGCKSVTQIEMMGCPPETRQASNPWPQWPKVLKTDYGAQESIAKFGHDPRIYSTTIKSVHKKDGAVAGVTTVQVEFKVIDGKRTLCQIPGTEKELPCDIILVAVGFVGCQEYTAEAFGVALGARGTVATCAPDVFKTNIDKVFTAGDMHRGQSLVVWAIYEGRQAARTVDEFLMGYSNM